MDHRGLPVPVRAVLCHGFGPPQHLKLGEVPRSELGPGQVRVKIAACGVNFADLLMVQGQYQEKPAFPFSPGLEVSGTISEVSEGTVRLKVGDRVAVLCGHGGMAEEVCVPEQAAVPIPDAMDFVTAAGFLVVYGTSHLALAHRAKLQPDEVLLVHGAAGGVGLTAVEIGKKLGATVIATASTAEKLALAEEYGADHLINYREQSFRDEVKAITKGRGANVIYDPVGGDVFDQSLRCIAWEGRLLVIGFASGRVPKLQVSHTLVKNYSVVGIYWGAYAKRDPTVLQGSLTQLFSWYVAGELRPHISKTYPLEQASQALDDMAKRRVKGKVVLEVSAE